MNNTSFAYYRLPYADTYTKVSANRLPNVIGNYAEIGEQKGFIIAPFNNSKHPIVLIPNDNIETGKVADISSSCEQISESSHKADYLRDFHLFHDSLTEGVFTKLVLARSERIETSNTDLGILFHAACKNYPRAMVMLFDTPLTGCWLIVSPEILIDSEGDHLKTVALAGTMPYTEGVPDWNSKNKREQALVEQYIDTVIAPYAEDIIKDGPHTIRAGNVMHLRTVFRFHLQQKDCLGKLISALHPTPAVCGIPKDSAIDFILTNEHCNREYYSGFAGPIDSVNNTHLYVSLRCARLGNNECYLYAGGGILPDSDAESEWKETENKMQTIRKLFSN